MALAITAKHVLTGIGNILPRGQPKEPAKTTAAAFCRCLRSAPTHRYLIW